jgi:DNA-binding CsgD family transcriptional regulator
MSAGRRSIESLVGGIAEIALGAASPDEAWPEIIPELERTIGFDSGFVASTTGSIADGRGAFLGHDEGVLRVCLGPYLGQIKREEIGAYTDRARRADEIWNRERRCELAAHYEPLHPRRARHMLVRVGWRNGVLLGVNLERSSRPFSERELAIVDAIAPVCHLVDLVARRSGFTPAPAWPAAWKLTAREVDVTTLVLRGLQNSEIAGVLGLSRNTVRNTLARVFPKAGATTRAELVFLAGARADHRDGGLRVARDARKDGMIRFFENVRGLLDRG